MTNYTINTNTNIIKTMLTGAKEMSRQELACAIEVGSGAASQVIEQYNEECLFNNNARSWRTGRLSKLNGTPLVVSNCRSAASNDLTWKAHASYIRSANRFISTIIDGRKVIYGDLIRQV